MQNMKLKQLVRIVAWVVGRYYRLSTTECSGDGNHPCWLSGFVLKVESHITLLMILQIRFYPDALGKSTFTACRLGYHRAAFPFFYKSRSNGVGFYVFRTMSHWGIISQKNKLVKVSWKQISDTTPQSLHEDSGGSWLQKAFGVVSYPTSRLYRCTITGAICLVPSIFISEFRKSTNK
jgi:hypothetical protein